MNFPTKGVLIKEKGKESQRGGGDDMFLSSDEPRSEDEEAI